jgi:transcriptional regulator with PAS, ATPase and Fis domain
LDEIGDIPLRLQGKLLQVIENQIVRRLGQSKTVMVDVRIIAATNKDLAEAVRRKSFRQDLYYRLNVLTIKLPPLRERKEDIALLIEHFLEKHCPDVDKETTQISPEVIDILCKYYYPGNVRELENIIQRSIVMAKGAIILPEHLPEELKAQEISKEPESLADMEKQMIESAIKQYKGNLNKAAKKLGIHYTTLWRKMKKLNINISS